jgi:coiled-coil domain-containing protein 61
MSKMTMANKRYLILSYIVEFDKVHYPLPLNFDDNPPVD